jgi:DtxR family Mn-dependent transcriptional regulator
MTKERGSDSYTASVEDYLKTIYKIEESSGAAATNDIATRLAVAPASVSGMVRRLADQGLLEHERYRGVRLTDEGRRVALSTMRRHRIIELYLVEQLGYSWDLVHDEAERLEHAASNELIDRMAAVLGEPTLDPHGAPIPTREGEIEEEDDFPLTDLLIGETGRITRVSDSDSDLLRYLTELGLTLGAVVTIKEIAPFVGPITLRIAEEEAGDRIIAHHIAHAIRLQRVE